MNFPSELKYTKDHEWIRVEGTDAYIGITEFAQQELGDIVYIDINKLGALKLPPKKYLVRWKLLKQFRIYSCRLPVLF